MGMILVGTCFDMVDLELILVCDSCGDKIVTFKSDDPRGISIDAKAHLVTAHSEDKFKCYQCVDDAINKGE